MRIRLSLAKAFKAVVAAAISVTFIAVATGAASQPADTVGINGKIYTMNKK